MYSKSMNLFFYFKASFVSDKAGLDVDLDDPDFWKKWAQKASVNLEDLKQVCSSNCFSLFYS